MSGEFDPYHRWLGIPPKHQPANHYRLLGLELFEEDPEVIHDGAERQMAHVRTYQLGPDVELSQQILNELALAKACLQDPGRKAAYDVSLRATLQPRPAVAVPPPPPRVATPPPPPPPSMSTPPAAISTAPQAVRLADVAQGRADPVSTRSIRRFPPGSSMSPWIGGGTAVALLVGIGVVVFLSRRPSPSLPQPDPSISDTLPIKSDAPPRVADKKLPRLAPIPPQRVEVGKKLEVLVRIQNPGTFDGQISFRLAADKPRGATIDERSGRFEWVLSQEQPPGMYPITVEIWHPGAESRDDQVPFTITVEKPGAHMRNPAAPLKISPIEPQTVTAGKSHAFPVTVQRPEGFEGNLLFSLRDEPSWVKIDRESGTVTCVSEESDAGRSYSAVVCVASSTPEAMHAEMRFDIRVKPKEAAKPEFAVEVKPASIKILESTGEVRTSADFLTYDNACKAGATLIEVYLSNGGYAFFPQDPITKKYMPTKIAFLASRTGNRVEGVAVCLDSNSEGEQFHGLGHLNLYAPYKNEKWEGNLSSWTAKDGQELRQFWCQYYRGKRHGLCCLFADDNPVAALEYTHGNVGAVYLLDAQGKVTKMTTNTDDPDLDRVLKEVKETEQRLIAQDDYLIKTKKGILSLISSKKGRAQMEAAQYAMMITQLLRSALQSNSPQTQPGQPSQGRQQQSQPRQRPQPRR